MATPSKRTKLEATIPDFSKPLAQSNVTFVFDDGKRLYFNRGGLAFFSPVFERMLLGDWKEGNNEEVPLPLKSFNDFHTILRMITQYDEALITDANLAAVLSLADEYEMRNILVYCSNYMLKHWQIGDMRFEALELALQFDLRTVAEVLLPEIVCGRMADLKVAAEVLSAKVCAVLLRLRIVRLNELAKIGFSLQCYPRCITHDKAFACNWCRRGGADCTTGHCVRSTVTARRSMCRWCSSGDGAGDLCGTCRRHRGPVEDEICICGVNCDHWLADEVVNMLLNNKN